jgi:CRISPR-associated endoribonuclease Cas6
MFSTPVKKNYEHLVLGIFADQKFTLHFTKEHFLKALITSVEAVEEPHFESSMKFVCLSPIAVTTGKKIGDKTVQHYLDYMIPEEREQYISNLRNNLLKKYKLVHKREFSSNSQFGFSFDPAYIVKRKGSIRKNIRFKRDKQTGRFTHIIGMEAPFTIDTDPELIKIGYQCGFGEKNSAGFGMAEKIDNE